jgi:hypothetical protein
MASISYLAHPGPHGWRYGQSVRFVILPLTDKLSISRIRALWTAVSSPRISVPFKSTWLTFWASHVASSWGAEI